MSTKQPVIPNSQDALYVRRNGRYHRIGMIKPWLPDGIHLVHVSSGDTGESTYSYFNVDLADIHRQVKITATRKQAEEIVYKAFQGRPAVEKLTQAEYDEWQEFLKTKLGKKLARGITFQSANDVAREILAKLVEVPE